MNEISFMFTPTINIAEGISAKSVPKSDISVNDGSFANLLISANQKAVNELNIKQLSTNDLQDSTNALLNFTQKNPIKTFTQFEKNTLSEEDFNKAVPFALNDMNLAVVDAQLNLLGNVNSDENGLKIPIENDFEFKSQTQGISEKVQAISQFTSSQIGVIPSLINKSIDDSSNNQADVNDNIINISNDLKSEMLEKASNENLFRHGQYKLNYNEHMPFEMAKNIPIVEKGFIGDYESKAVNEQANFNAQSILSDHSTTSKKAIDSTNLENLSETFEDLLLNPNGNYESKAVNEQANVIKLENDLTQAQVNFNAQSILSDHSTTSKKAIDSTNLENLSETFENLLLNSDKIKMVKLSTQQLSTAKTNAYGEKTLQNIIDLQANVKAPLNLSDASDEMRILNREGNSTSSKVLDDIIANDGKLNADATKTVEKTQETLDFNGKQIAIIEKFVIEGKEIAISPKEVVKQVEVALKPMMSQVSNNAKHELVVELNPVELGKITIQLVSEAGKISVKLITETEVAAQILAHRSENMQEIFKSQNLQLENYQLISPKSEYHAQDYSGSAKNPYQEQEQKQNQQNQEPDFDFEQFLMMQY